MREFLAGLEADIELCEQHNSYLAIENHGNALLDSLDSFKAFVDINRSPRVGIALAPYHLQAISASVEKAIEISGKQLLFFYAWQQAPGVGQLPGHGPTDFTPWIAALSKVNYRGCVNPFMHGDVKPDAMSQALAASRDYLKQCNHKRKAER
jgi:sugar phosphate isomerase/epimerase